MSKREMAVFTIVQNDPWMTARWHKYYSRYFEPQDIYILDHLLAGNGCADPFADRCNVDRVQYDLTFDHIWLKALVEAKQRWLLDRYEKVLFAEIDEFVAPDPNKYADLTDYIRRFSAPVGRVAGYNVVQVGDQPRLDLTADSILSQRTHWAAHEAFDKPLLATVPLEYTLGFHTAADAGRGTIDSDLHMIHLKWVCLDYLIEKNREICERRWSSYDWQSNMGVEHKMLSPEDVRGFIASNMKPPTPIPEKFRHLL